MGSVCAEQQQHKFHHSHQLFPNKKSLREIDIPPRKLLSRRSAASGGGNSPADIFTDSPKVEDAVFSKFLPYNNVDDDDSDPYSSDHFRMYEFKVRKCTRSRSHDWTDCPFAHPGEKARRRDPRRFHYSGTVCSEFRKGHCAKGDNCEFSHGVFECWLHPTRYRTEACKDGKNCKRKVCFFAHSSRQLRILPEPSSPPSMNSPTAAAEKNYHHHRHCCLYCHASPTSTLMGMSHLSPPVSPPISPVDCCSPEFSRYGGGGGDRFSGIEAMSPAGSGMTYKDALTELMSSLEGMNVNESSAHHHMSHAVGPNRNLPWLDMNFSGEEQPQFVLSPSTSNPSPGSSKIYSGDSKFYRGDFPAGRTYMMEENRYNSNEGSTLGGGGPDFGWVNDLLT